ncbi:anthranilate synthase component I [Marinisporobacter balticus]|uniref:Anthranilate synthase component 1 n=1 Tax=Marinisporobacter balticus TaxID=2018667 RepID=A0A4R2KS37_9FIRM|nr:anthranilate synthase component I [Marinisporobacter balticus]TCO73799.1 anthranilate synthase component I [Marinisporobacter balticus]
MIYPKYQNFIEMSKGQKMIPISMEIGGDMDTPITLFKKLCKDKNSYLLESVEGGNKWGRYSYIGRKPFMRIKSYGDQVLVEKEDEVIHKNGNIIEILKNIMGDYKIPQIDEKDDFVGGAVGYIGYDVIRNYEDLKHINFDDMKMPDVHLLLAEEVIVYDHLKQRIKIIVNLSIGSKMKALYKDGVKRLEEIKREILENDFDLEDEKENHLEKVNYLSNETKEAYIKKVLRAKEYIENGDIFQVVLSQRLKVKTEVNPFKAYRTLRTLNPSPYMFYIDFGEYHLVGSSPELLVKVKGDTIETCPIAGTRPRGKTIEEDEKYATELLKDEKERAEHLMLVDLSRNDIGKISKFGSVEVNQFMEIQKYSHVMHIVSNVIGEKMKDYDMYDGLIACLPAGTVSGAPKVRAMEIIDELENNKRGVYAGAVGYVGFNGNMDTCIAIRTIVFKDGFAYIQAGAGIVADSNPESEYEETIRKAKALIETIRKAEGEKV